MVDELKKKQKYIALTGINFEALKPRVRIEKGDSIPASVPDATIKDLLSDGAIEEIKETPKETKS